MDPAKFIDENPESHVIPGVHSLTKFQKRRNESIFAYIQGVPFKRGKTN
jgi:hypothetical protein